MDNVSLVTKKRRSRWLHHVEHKNGAEWIKCCTTMEIDRVREGHPRKTWWDGVREDMKRFGLSRENAQDWTDAEGKSRGQLIVVHQFDTQYFHTSELQPPHEIVCRACTH